MAEAKKIVKVSERWHGHLGLDLEDGTHAILLRDVHQKTGRPQVGDYWDGETWSGRPQVGDYWDGETWFSAGSPAPSQPAVVAEPESQTSAKPAEGVSHAVDAQTSEAPALESQPVVPGAESQNESGAAPEPEAGPRQEGQPGTQEAGSEATS